MLSHVPIVVPSLLVWKYHALSLLQSMGLWTIQSLAVKNCHEQLQSCLCVGHVFLLSTSGDCWVVRDAIFKETAKLFFQVAIPFYIGAMRLRI